MSRLFDQDEADRYVQERVDSREWWIIVGVSELASIVEDNFYRGEANDDFDVVIGPPAGEFKQVFPHARILPLAFAHKRRMSDTQLSRLLADNGVQISPEELERQDIIFAFDTSDG